MLTLWCALLGTLFCARTIWPVGARDEVTKTADDDDRLAADTPGREMGASLKRFGCIVAARVASVVETMPARFQSRSSSALLEKWR